MRLSRRLLAAASLAVVLLASRAGGETATTRNRARLREGPSAATELLGEVEAGTVVQLLGERGGWRQVLTPDGRTGYLWAEHLEASGSAVRPPEPARSAAETPTPPARLLAEEVRDLRTEVSALARRPEPATASDLERLREEVARVNAAQRDLARRLDDRLAPSLPAHPPPDAMGTLAPVLLVAGGVIGFVASRVMQRRHDRRQRGRIRL